MNWNRIKQNSIYQTEVPWKHKSEHQKRRIRRCVRDKKEQKQTRDKRLNEIALHLETNIPPHEVWFRSHYEAIKHEKDKYCKPLGNDIPSVHNDMFKYAIQVYDKPPLVYCNPYKRLDYKIFHLVAEDMAALETLLKEVRWFRELNTFNYKLVK